MTDHIVITIDVRKIMSQLGILESFDKQVGLDQQDSGKENEEKAALLVE
ncbi:hypothetical protein [Paenibacillus sp. UNC451MF]|nr:hypothetical protein [Paenibacillus sp. UNC451MF]